jgi:hypothetical protein
MAVANRELFSRVLGYQNELIAFFTGGGKFDEDGYQRLRADLLNNQSYSGLAPSFLRKCRDTGALWSFAKGIDGSWEPRRVFLREQFEPLLDLLENGPPRGEQYPGEYDASAWTGVPTGVQRVVAIRTMIPLAQASIEVLIAQLEAPNHNGAPPLDELDEALKHLKALHSRLGEILQILDKNGKITLEGEGLIAEAARYGKRAAKALKEDPIPYALSASILAILSACGFPGIAGYLGGIALAVRKPRNP